MTPKDAFYEILLNDIRKIGKYQSGKDQIILFKLRERSVKIRLNRLIRRTKSRRSRKCRRSRRTALWVARVWMMSTDKCQCIVLLIAGCNPVPYDASAKVGTYWGTACLNLIVGCAEWKLSRGTCSLPHPSFLIMPLLSRLSIRQLIWDRLQRKKS